MLNEPSYTNPLNNPQVVFPRVFPATGTGGPSSVGLPVAQNPDYRTPYSMQYNFTIERQQWNTGFRVSYIGTSMRKGPWMYNYNSPAPDNRPFTEKPRPFNDFPEVWYVTNGAGHQYKPTCLTDTLALACWLAWVRCSRGFTPSSPMPDMKAASSRASSCGNAVGNYKL